MAPDLAIRQVRPDEHDRVVALTLAAYAQFGLDVGDYRASLADVTGRAAAAHVLVAVRVDDVVGAVTYVPDRDNPYAEFTDDDAAGIRMLAVDPAAQGTGVGTALVDTCVVRAVASGRRRVVLHTTSAMAAAQRLYVRAGFQRSERRDWSPAEGVDLLGYVLPIGTVADGRSGRSVEA
jgi:ribosomal protein S18 acetylase RimI-like enzyme